MGGGSMSGTDFLIIGGGVVGRSLAYHLAGLGAQVTVVDRGCAGGCASGAAAGMLTPLSEAEGPGPYLDFGLAALAYYADLVPELEAEAGRSVEYSTCGLLRVALDEAGAEELGRRVAWQSRIGDVEWLEAEEVSRLEPGLTPVAAAVFCSGENQVNAPAMVVALTLAGTRRGVRRLEGKEVVGFLTGNGRVTGVRLGNSGEEGLEAGHVIVAAGAWTGRIGEWLGVDLPVFPVRGEVMSFLQPTPSVNHIVFAGGTGYAAPKADGTVIIGATQDRSGFAAGVTAGGIAYLSTTAIRLFPAMESARFQRAWAGLRPGSADDHPLIGSVPGWDGLSVASGHYRKGILLGPLTGKLLAERLTGVSTGTGDADLLSPFDPARFSSGLSTSNEPPAPPNGAIAR